MSRNEGPESRISLRKPVITPMDSPVEGRPEPTGRERARSRWVTVEPVIVMAMVGYLCTVLVKPFYVKDTISHHYNYSETKNDTPCGGQDPGNDTIDNKIQSESSMWLLYLGVASGVPAMMSSIVFCTISDRLGRKLAMALPVIGFAFQAVVYVVTVHFKLPLAVLLAGEFVQGLTGGFGLLFAACISYITDATTEKQRTLRIVIAEMLTFLVSGLNQVAQGYLLTFGYLPSLAIAFGCNVIALLYIVIPLFLIETVDGQRSDSKGLLDVWRSMKRLLEFNENGRRWQMLLLDFFIFFVISQFVAYSSIFVLYGTAEPFCWTSFTAGIASALGFVLSSFGMLIGTKVLSYCLGEYWLMQISCLSMLAAFTATALAQSTLVIYIGATFSIVGCLESFSSFIANLAATSIYGSTVSFLPPLTFYVFAGATIIPMVTVLFLQVCWPRRKEYTRLEVNSCEN
ncbi:proton-coupled folate transporter-like isoform X2 [Acanthaster planci]|uniref:Proton-coupled folate transporter n=1 Tax=Acanthaster planci TaxID=133434 RepID=A0A8B7ZZ10_ACAPL|nr:proton-coupled folate transporter-like isoform X2 [Acanthaster planci]